MSKVVILDTKINADTLMCDCFKYYSVIDPRYDDTIQKQDSHGSVCARILISIDKYDIRIKKITSIIADLLFMKRHYKTDLIFLALDVMTFKNYQKEINSDICILLNKERNAFEACVFLADEILVMEKGCILAKGKHEDLLKNCNLYKQLFHYQADKYVKK